MPIYHETVENRYVVLRGEGLVTAPEVFEANRWLYTELEDKNIARYQLWDNTALTRVEVTNEDVRRFAQESKVATQSLSRIAIAIVGTTNFTYGLARMYEAYSYDDRIQTMVFRDRVDAEKWLLAMIEKG